jgi:glycosyltransferase involved in cell wall biosynthesis
VSLAIQNGIGLDPYTFAWKNPGDKINVTTQNRAVLITCYMSGSTEGRNLGTAGYSYDFVASLFAELLSQWATVIWVPELKNNLELAAAAARSNGLEPIHVSFLPFQDVVLCKSAPNIVVPAWEFPDIPDQVFNNDERNDWVQMANQCDMVAVGGRFTVESLRKGGVTTPIRVVPVPTADGYFRIPEWNLEQNVEVPCRAFWPQRISFDDSTFEDRKSCLKDAKVLWKRAIRSLNKAIIGPENYEALSGKLKQRRKERQKIRSHQKQPVMMSLSLPSTPTLKLSGVVYTSIFNPDDGRKNWMDLLNGYLFALKDCDDATLVLKLITRRRQAVEAIVKHYQQCDIEHRCRLALVVDFLDDSQMMQLASGSTYYLQTTRAEGNCLPLMNYLASGRPAISPCHSAIADYFDERLGWVIESHAEPTAWPHDPYLRTRTTWGRIVWTSVRDQIRQSYEVAKQDPEAYSRLSGNCREKMLAWASNHAVWKRLEAALDELVNSRYLNHRNRTSDNIPDVVL